MSAEGELLMTTDADCRLPEKWIFTFTSFYRKYRPDLIIGAVHLQEKQGFFSRFQELEFMSLQGITAGTAALGNPIMCNGANLGISREKYLKHAVKLHDEVASGDDMFLMESIKSENGKILWLGDEEATVQTSPSPTLGIFLKQRARWISKSGTYKDPSTRFIALAAFAANADLAILLVCSIVCPFLLFLYMAAFLIKSSPDILITHEVTRWYKKSNLLWWFIPSQVIYPFYVLAVSAYSLFRRNKW
jgi:cellulose synthase/poly-beta-1,6-N-acetylglucosamine synthase-like glycosyltransferase